MSIRTVSKSRPGRPPFYIELLFGHRPCRKPDVEALIDDCLSTPYFSYAFPSGHVAARVFVLQWTDAFEAAAFFWSHHLDGRHHLTPSLRLISSDPSLLSDLSDKLKPVFASHVREILEGESVRKCEKKIDGILGEIVDLKKTFGRRPQRFAVCDERVYALAPKSHFPAHRSTLPFQFPPNTEAHLSCL